MSPTKNNLPAMPFYVGDWLKCPEVRALPPDYRGLWFDMICFMWESTERGVMVNPKGKPYTDQDIIRMVGLDNHNSGIWLTRLIDDGVCSRREDGAIYSKRMVKEERIRQLRRNCGQKGGFAKAKHLAKSQQNIEYENEYENEIEDKGVDIFNQKEHFEVAWDKYPVKDGKKAAQRSFNASVASQADFDRLMAAMANYTQSERVLKGFVKNGSTFFANWKDWEAYVPPKPKEGKPQAEFVAVSCVAQKMTDVQIKDHMLGMGYTEHRIDEAIMKAR